MKTRFKDLTFADPNAWIVNEWDAVEADQIIEPHPYEVSSRQAVNFKLDNEELLWLFVRLESTFEKVGNDGESKETKGLKHTL